MGSNIHNMKQAVYEVFGVGSGIVVDTAPIQETPTSEELSPAAQQTLTQAPSATIAVPSVSERMTLKPVSYFAEGTVFEGTMRCNGDVEVAGSFKGELEAEGAVTLYASMEGNVKAGNLTLVGCALSGDASVADTLSVGEGAGICGNISTKELLCAGKIDGDLTVGGNAALERTAQLHGNIVTGSFSVAKGAVICGSIEIKDN